MSKATKGWALVGRIAEFIARASCFALGALFLVAAYYARDLFTGFAGAVLLLLAFDK